LLINGSPPNLEFSNIPVMGTGEPIVNLLETADGSVIEGVRFEWDSESDTDPIGNQSGAEFLPLADWGSQVGVMRVDLVPSSTTDRNAAVAGGYSFLLYPNQNGDTTFSTGAGLNGQGAVMVTRCDATGGYRCSAEVTLSGSVSSGYYLRLQSYYNPLRARIAALDAGGNEVTLQNGQAIVDVTGQANDVYRRIQVRLPLNNSIGFHPPFVLFSGDTICKRYVGIPGGTAVDAPDSTDPSCWF